MSQVSAGVHAIDLAVQAVARGLLAIATAAAPVK